ncbi:MAG: hypothetical protein F4065_03800 [Rhodothermaceae bacterium]|nr:hypothetical protein [Rhodothermaceae bacterium]MXZ57839.1 hypothetical protein [Rhodothermaceae bacterium]MYB91098.1 hypothetical protein [Rhodothermaceae bacterium]MYD67424.1 hypothetical protein [Rhodothermaceae bacterium]MYG45199.1 hypothetical protein [Rhodothermaceae bacterium]
MRKFWMNLLAVVASYFAIAITIMVIYSLAYLILGAEGSYQTGSWNVSTTWVILSIIVGLGSAWLGGKICTRIAGNYVAAKYLIALIIVLGVVTALTTNQGDMETVREVTPSIMEAMGQSIVPMWYVWLNPLLGALGVAIGSGVLNASSGKNSE